MSQVHVTGNVYIAEPLRNTFAYKAGLFIGIIPEKNVENNFWKSLGVRNVVYMLVINIFLIVTITTLFLNIMVINTASIIDFLYLNGFVVKNLVCLISIDMEIWMDWKNRKETGLFKKQLPFTKVRTHKERPGRRNGNFMMLLLYILIFLLLVSWIENVTDEGLVRFVKWYCALQSLLHSEKCSAEESAMRAKVLVGVIAFLQFFMNLGICITLHRFVAACCLVNEEQESFNEELSKLVDRSCRPTLVDGESKLPKHESTTTARKLLLWHTELLNAVCAVERRFSSSLLFWMSVLVTSLLQIVSVLIDTLKSGKVFLYSFSYTAYGTWLVYQLVVIIIACSRVHDKGQSSILALQNIISNTYASESSDAHLYMVLLQKMITSPMQLTCRGFFAINKSFVVSLFMGLISYCTILYQLQEN